MKQVSVWIVLFVVLITLLGGTQVTAAQVPTEDQLALAGSNLSPAPLGLAGGMPGWPVPDKPIPQHEPGRPSRAGNYSTQVTQINAQGLEEVVSLTGLDAMLADGVISDPLQGNYRLVSKDNIAFGVYDSSDFSINLEAYENITVTQVISSEISIPPIASSERQSLDITAGDLNGDGVDEQIAAWVDVNTQNIMLAIGEMPGTNGRSSSEPAAAAFGDNIDLVVRGYDQALWHAHYNGTTWGDWNNKGEGLLLSGPAIAPRDSGAFDVFVVGFTDPEDDDADGIYTQVYQLKWGGTAWAGSWVDLPLDPVFTTVPDWIGPPPELPAPAAVASGMERYIFRIAPDNTLRWNHSDDDGVTWGEWDGLGGMLASGPGALVVDGRVQVFAVGVDGALWYRIYDGSWDAWQRVALDGMEPTVSLTSAPTPVELTNGDIRVYALGSDGALWQVTYDNVLGTWGAWSSEDGGDLDSRPAVAVLNSDLEFFGLADDGRMLTSSAGGTWGDFDEPWLPACCLGTPIDTGIRSYVTASDNVVDQINLLDIETGHFLGDGRRQIALAYTWEVTETLGLTTGIGLRLYDINDGFTTLSPLGGLGGIDYEDKNYYVEDYYPKITVGQFDDDAPQEIALAYATRKGGVRVYNEDDFDGRELAWLKAGTYNFDDEDEMDMNEVWNNRITSIKISDGWQACFHAYWSHDIDDNDPDPHSCYTGHLDIADLGGEIYQEGGGAMDDTISRVVVVEVGTFDLESVDVTDGIYTQNNAHIAVEIINFDAQNHELTHEAVNYYEMKPADGDHYPAPERTLEIAAGNFDGGENDEIAILYDIYCEGDLCDDAYYVYFNILEVENNKINSHGNHVEERKMVDSLDGNPSGEPTTDLHLATGDFDGDGRDEIVRTWPTNDSFFVGFWPLLERSLQVLDWNDGWSVLDSFDLPEFTQTSHQDALVAGDLNLDLKDEIIFLNSTSSYKLQSYSLSSTSGELEFSGEEEFSSGESNNVLATGDFTGESLRVGKPTYRVESKVGGLIALINEPPKHFDTIGGVDYEINSQDTDTYASYENEQSQSTEMSLQVTRDWEMATGLEITAGDPEGTHVTASLNTTYGEHFENTTTAFNEITFGSKIRTSGDDLVDFSRTNYQVWEYPLYNDLDNHPDGYITVIFPQPPVGTDQVTDEDFTWGNTCDFWYQPNHQLNNVWSYPSDVNGFSDYDSDKGWLNGDQTFTLGEGTGDFWTRWDEVDSDSQASAVNLGVSSGIEAQVGGDEIPIVGYRIPWSVKASFEASYEEGSLSTHKMVGSDSTTIHTHFNSIAPNASYEVTPYLYWSQGGYLVLDYVTTPNTGTSFWKLYDKPDPAIIRPWADGDCGDDRADFSKEIVIDPPFAKNGEVITVTATVRNFSNIEVDNVVVRFYQGDPDQGGVQIGPDQTIVTLSPRDRQDVSVQAPVFGSDEQRIYAVVDPDGQLTEMHADNNKAYGVLVLGAAEFMDPGDRNQGPYSVLTYTSEITVAAYIPLGNFDEITRFELRASPLIVVPIVGEPFELLAYQGSSGDWNAPADDFDLVPETDNPPAVITIAYDDPDIAGYDESSLQLYRLGDTSLVNSWSSTISNWVPATCPGYDLDDLVRFPEDNLLAVPICQTGTFVLSDQQPELESKIYLPLVIR